MTPQRARNLANFLRGIYKESTPSRSYQPKPSSHRTATLRGARKSVGILKATAMLERMKGVL